MSKLNPGDKAPRFTGTDQNGNKVSLEDFKGKNLVLYFYPKDDTPGCTAEACNFRDNYASLVSKGYEVVGVSVDDEKSHQQFREKHDLPFTLLADENKKIVEDYGVWGEKNMFGRKYMGTNRVTFVIDGEGIIKHAIRRVDSKNASWQILDLENKA
ncbi:peroxiredoxin Q/BCP [Anseongella ginsenosidimutans]|uniref:thioredoxin-dependent peroxiredoxin n=1 Tax=Anseongella ginsenosidimutans TaxID=496056 RepID=A0A4R3KXX5_9SPHI|nr:thioredoxin-dependent thiol peroxidase [Anseongella ginsenosidimutans]QEC51010.1 thioredoxin-dependent thiol peroxidase [Anseongella ginsenosidimutans]TCS90338.1 peroxiredoxin Q/BCP [Anseongella ginsenosidimutans]